MSNAAPKLFVAAIKTRRRKKKKKASSFRHANLFFPETRFARDGGGEGGERSKASQHALRKKEVVSKK